MANFARYLLEMKIDLSIYQSILFHDLRPWIESNKVDDKFKAKLSPQFKSPTPTAQDFDNALNKALKDFPSTLNEQDYIFDIPSDQVQFKGMVDELLYPLLEMNYPEPINNKTTFYYYLIKNEGTRLINNLQKLSFLSIGEKEKKTYFTKTIQEVNSLMAKIQEKKKQLEKIDDTSIKTDSNYILDFLRTTLVRLHLEIKELFEIYTTGSVYDEAGIFQNIIKLPAPNESLIQDNTGLNHYKVATYINSQKHTKETTIEWILYTIENYNTYYSNVTTTREATKRKQSLLKDLQALENLYFFITNKLKSKKLSFDDLINDETAEEHFNNAFQAGTEEIEEHHLPNKRLAAVNKQLQKLAYVEYDINTENIQFLQSIPRRLKEALTASKLFINANLAIDFSKITEPKTNPLKTNLSVPQLAFLFKLLHEIKPEIFQVPTNAELFRFISQNFITKKSSADGISTKKLGDLFREPDRNAQQFWLDIITNWYTDKKKFK